MWSAIRKDEKRKDLFEMSRKFGSEVITLKSVDKTILPLWARNVDIFHTMMNRLPTRFEAVTRLIPW